MSFIQQDPSRWKTKKRIFKKCLFSARLSPFMPLLVGLPQDVSAWGLPILEQVYCSGIAHRRQHEED